jgi:RNA polymerase sigma factor (sigma-70 family)
MARLLRFDGLETEVFYNGRDFLSKIRPDDHGCILLDLKMPRLNGLDVQNSLLERGITLPIIFLTGHGDVESVRNALKLGAYDFIQKPVLPEILLDLVHKAIDLDSKNKKSSERFENLEARLNKLSQREREVASYIACGYTSKEIARLISISPRTVEAHRSRIMIKLQVECLADLVSIVTLYNRIKTASDIAGMINMDERVFKSDTCRSVKPSLRSLRSV